MSAFERLLEQKAVALQYSPEKDSAPVIVASGMGYMACQNGSQLQNKPQRKSQQTK